MNANITVLKDESLGGVEREYCEVKRKADVGERIKIVDKDCGYELGRIFTVTDADYDWGGIGRHRDGTGVGIDGDITLFHKRYITLESTDIVRINGTRFRMVDRKAAVGERVIVTGESCACYQTGDHAKVLSSNGRVAFVDLTENADYYDDGKWYIDRSDYRVLEPVESAESAQQPEPLSAKPAPDQAAEIIVALTRRVTALEKRVAALETLAEVADEEVAEISRIALDPPVFSGVSKLSRIKSPQEIRDDIVKRAKEDVADLLAQNHPDVCVTLGVWLSTKGGITVTDRVDFVVDREKRTVVALIIDIKRKKVIGRGIAKCAPDDVFNSHIGRAIALRRALGLEIPEEYVSAPLPTEVRVGDVVDETDRMKRKGRVVDAIRPIGYSSSEEGLTFEGGGWAYICECKILDDSREDSAEPRKEVA